MRILFTGDLLEEGKNAAPLVVAFNLFNSLVTNKQDIRYFTYFKEGSKYSYYKKLFAKDTISRTPAIIKYGLLPLVLNIIRFKPHIIYLTNIEFFYILLFPLKFFLRFKLVYTVHGLIHYELKHYRSVGTVDSIKGKLIEKMLFRYCDKLLFLSEKSVRLASIYFRIKTNRCEIVDNGIAYDTNSKRYAVPIDKINLKIAIIAATGKSERKEKGLDILLRYLNSNNSKYEINYYGTTKELSQEAGNIKIHYSPYLTEEKLSKALISNDLLIVPSRYEQFNMGLLKAMGLGMLFLSSDRVGLTERFDNILNQFVYRYNNCEDFHCKLNYILNMNNDELKYYNEYIRNFTLHFTWDKISEKYLSIFNEIR